MAKLSLQADSVRINPKRFNAVAFPYPLALVDHFAPLGSQSFAEAILARYSPHDIANVIEALIGVLDALGGDPDLEDDDPSGQCDEDGINTRPAGTSKQLYGPGCTMSDDDRDEGGIRAVYGVDQTFPHLS